VSSCKLIVIESDCRRQGANISNHPIQNPLLLAIEPRTRDIIYIRTLHFSGRVNEYITSVARKNFTIGIDVNTLI
jgi:hypothetical protein